MAAVSHKFAYELIEQSVQAYGPTNIALSPYSVMSVLQALSLGIVIYVSHT